MKTTERETYKPIAFRPTKSPEELTIWEGFELWKGHHLADKGGSKDTLENYRSDLKKLVQYLEAQGMEPLLHLVTEDVIRAFIIDYQTKANPAPNTLYRLKACLKSVFSYLARKGYIPSDPTQEIRLPRAGRKVVRVSRVIPIEVRKRLARDAWKEGFREYLMFCLRHAYGARSEQLRRLRWTDIDFANKTIRFCELKNGGSGGGPISDELLELLKEFKEGGYGGEIYVFRSRQGEPISKSQMKKITNKLFKGGFPVKEYNSHDMRTTVATEISQRPGCNTRAVQEILGHRRAETTVGYERADSEIMREVIGERFKMIDVRPKMKDDVAATTQPAIERENRKENNNPDLKPAFTFSPDVYLQQSRDVTYMLALVTLNFRQGVLSEREYKLVLEAIFSSLRSNTRPDGGPDAY